MGDRIGPLDLRDNEHLCAIALVKRLFPKIAAKALGWPLDTSHWPSTVYTGAVPWIRRVAAAAPEQARRYAEAVCRSGPRGVLMERQPRFDGFAESAAGNFPKLDSNYYHHTSVQTEGLCPLPHVTKNDRDARDELVGLLKALYNAKDESGKPLGAPPSFYALLLADGDRLGRLVGCLGGKRVGQALSAFTGKVPEIVRASDGVTVYAGGDDVLAMLAMPQALSCATALASIYRSAFANDEGAAPDGATLSAAVVFAHIRLPLGAVITKAHRLLDEVAKDANGRNSLAVGVLKGSGPYCQWATTWDRRGSDGLAVPALDLLDGLMMHLRGSEGVTPGLSSSLVYRVRDLLGRLCGWSRWTPGMWGTVPPGVDLHALLRAEILQSWTERRGEGSETDAGQLADLVGKLLAPARTTAAGDDGTSREVGLDALLLARFLSDPAGHEEERA